jgi:hypothetical protein
MLRSEITKTEAIVNFQDGRRRHFIIEVNAFKRVVTTRF